MQLSASDAAGRRGADGRARKHTLRVGVCFCVLLCACDTDARWQVGRGTGHLCLDSGHLCLVPPRVRIDFPQGGRFPPAAGVGTQVGWLYSKRPKKWSEVTGYTRHETGGHVTFYHSSAALAPKGARAGSHVHDKITTQQASNDNVKTSPQGVKFGVLMLSTCFHWREGWRP